jgi:hypothetical protein
MKYLNNEALVASKNIAVVTTQHLDSQLRKTGKFIAAAFSANPLTVKRNCSPCWQFLNLARIVELRGIN